MNKDMELMPRNIILQLSNNHCNDILKLCGKCNLTVFQLIETFLKSLLGESFAVIAHDVVYAEAWLEQYTNVLTKKSLLMFLYEEDIEAGDFTQLCYEIEIMQETLKNMQFLREPLEELENVKAELKQYEAEFLDYKTRYLEENPEADWEAEVRHVKEWSLGACQLLYGIELSADDSEEGFL